MDELPEPDHLITYLEWGVLGQKCPRGGQVYEVVIKVRPQGLLAILKSRSQDGFFVSFVGARGIRALSRVARGRVSGVETKWKEDQYPPT